MKKHLIYLLICFFCVSSFETSAEPVCHFYHFSTKDGLPQYTIMDILQDSKGLMWFGTWDGLSKFDGYKFYNYKVKPGDNYIMKSNRVEKIYEDKNNRIWFISYDGNIHCFSPKTEKFWGLQSLKKFEQLPFQFTKIQITASGKVWLISSNAGCVEVSDSLFNTIYYCKSNGGLNSDVVNSVFEDKNQNSWILTNDGIKLIPIDNSKSIGYKFGNNRYSKSPGKAFYSALQVNNDIWFGSGNGKVRIYSKDKNQFKLLDLKVTSDVNSFTATRDNRIVITTSNDGFFVYDLKNNQLKSFNASTTNGLSSNKIVSCIVDKANQLWIETDKIGVSKFDLKTLTGKFFYVKNIDNSTNMFPPRFFVIDDVNGRTWVQPKGGGFSLYNSDTDLLENYFSGQNSPELEFSNNLHSAYSDRQGNLWIGSRSHGLEKITFNQNYFKAVKINPETKTYIENDVRVIFEDNEKRLWISTKDGRLTVYDADKKIIGRLSKEGILQNDAIFASTVYCIIQDTDGNIWIGTKGEGLFKARKSGVKNRFTLQNFKRDQMDVFSLSNDKVYSLFQDKTGNIWVGTYGGGINLIKFMEDGKTYFINQRNHLKNYPLDIADRVRYITQDSKGNIWTGTTGGLIVFSSIFSIPENINFKYYSTVKGKIESLSNNDVHYICNTSGNEIYIATFGGGLNKVIQYDKNGFPLKFKQYMAKDGLPSDVTLSIREDNEKKLWISTENNLTRFDPQKETFETFAEINRLMNLYNFSEASNCITSKSEIIFGFSNGVIIFSPERIQRNLYRPNIAFSNFQLFNKDVGIGIPSPLTNSIDNIPELKLTHKQNFFSIEYAALDFVDQGNILYAYKLDGFDQDWNYVQKQRIANYTNLPKGEYVFRVKSTNSEGVWVSNERTLSIEVLPSFWETFWAYLIYILLFAGLIFLIVKILFTFYRLRANVTLEKKMSEMKLRFFTDISHEIRTPLTMITAPVDYMLNDSKTPIDIKKHLKTISQNTNRMLRLVNQILDFRKIQFHHLKVHQVEMGHFLEEICDNFSEIADEQHIKFRFTNKASTDKIWGDPDCLEKIIMNLLSNAFKFTAPGKSIEVCLLSDEKFVSVEVRDQGCGISKEKQKNLFVRFASFNEDKSKPSTGIGLSMVKDLADKHSAKISVMSEEGRGSVFTVSFLRGLSHFDKSVEIVAGVSKEEEMEKLAYVQEPVTGNEKADENFRSQKHEHKVSVLIVEDDNDLREFIKTILESEYLIFEAVDGTDGWEKAIKYTPDFVVSDIMMPRMDGIGLLQKLKTDIRTSHIPVVLLTAKTTIESKLEGLSYGADDYITKPFSVPYFQARIANLIQQRKQLHEYFRAQLIPNTSLNFNPQPYSITSHDEEMMKKVMSLIEENMENSEFSVEELGQCVQMSRSVFFKKLKGLTGLAPVEFIRDVKMKRAAQILSSGQYMVKEVAYLVGISDTKYFAKCFKAKYGLTPLEFKNQQQEENTKKTDQE